MKKKNLLVIMMAAMLSVGFSSCSDDNEDGTVKVQYPIEITATNFPDANFRKCLLQSNYGKDGILTEDEIRGITQLIIWDEGICSLQGIEYFTALTSLDCGSNQLASLDISKNTALTELGCSKNQLTSLDVSKNTVLTTLYCYNNRLTSLDVSKNTALTELHCYNNQLTALYVPKNTVLTRLNCGDNQLTSLDVSDCTILTSLGCSNNQLTSLDVSGCTILRQLDCSDNQLTSLDVSGCTELYGLYCYINQIKGASMDNLIKSLPTNNNEYSPFNFCVYSSRSSDEGNVCTKKQVKAAKEKGWRVYDSNYEEYEGCGDTPSNINDIRMEVGKDVPVYNLRGERLTAPQKGVNIIGGRKVVVK